MYYTYKITINNKIYIGYTGQSVEQRFHKHKINALAGIETHLYRAMRKYGIENTKCEQISSYEKMEDATMAEKQLIEKYDTIKNGMNMASGGSGGNTRLGMTNYEYVSYCRNMSKATTGANNPNYSGYSDEELINFGINIVKEYGYFSSGVWKTYAIKHKLPQSFSKNRFSGSFKIFKSEIQKHFDFDINYQKTKEHCDNISKTLGRYTVEELLDFGIKLVKEHGAFISDIWQNEYHLKYGTPRMFNKQKFSGSLVEFRQQIADKMGVDVKTIIDPFRYKHKKNREKYRNSHKK